MYWNNGNIIALQPVCSVEEEEEEEDDDYATMQMQRGNDWGKGGKERSLAIYS